MPRRIESLMLNGPAGRLEALLEEPEDRDPVEAALVCHPHPQHGGTMHNKVTYRLARGLRKAGSVVLRFNYRGVNLSEGHYAHGEGEVEDARSALSFLRHRYPNLPFTLASFSFGAGIVLRLACERIGARRVVAAGFPTVYKDVSYLNGCKIPRIFVQSTHDQYGPLADLTKLVATLPEPKQLIAIPAGDHFFSGGLDRFENAIVGLED